MHTRRNLPCFNIDKICAIIVPVSLVFYETVKTFNASDHWEYLAMDHKEWIKRIHFIPWSLRAPGMRSCNNIQNRISEPATDGDMYIPKSKC